MYNIYDTTVEEEHGQLLGYGGGVIGYFEKLIQKCKEKSFAKVITIADPQVVSQLDKAKTETEKHQILMKSGIGTNEFARKAFIYLLSDFCVYMEQSIQNAKEFRPQVALTLARKPLLDNLFYLMFLLCDQKAALQLIYENDSRKKDLRNLVEMDRNLCKQCSKMVDGCDDDNLLFELRYGKWQYSIKSSCDRALHIVTSNEIIRTHAGELNFVFMGQDSFDYHMKMYCKLIPATLVYVLKIVNELSKKLFEIFVEDEELLSIQGDFEDLLTKTLAIDMSDTTLQTEENKNGQTENAQHE